MFRTLPLNLPRLPHGRPSGGLPGTAGSRWHVVGFKRQFLTVRNRMGFLRAPRLPPLGAYAYVLIVDPGQMISPVTVKTKNQDSSYFNSSHSVGDRELLLVFKTETVGPVSFFSFNTNEIKKRSSFLVP